jgi:hypothetical protein
MITLLDMLKSVKVMDVQCAPRLAGAKYAVVVGKMAYLSPAMLDLLRADFFSSEETDHLLKNIPCQIIGFSLKKSLTSITEATNGKKEKSSC